ncbi:hypothetical protein R3I93_016801 [Phoxinus phoxinus]|uniref:Ig-like domain-containing protein n=1 Tax=Phoxinus phoxinus TaxID=58324 RepID=A0AAN9GXI0_9TELE
MHGFLFAMKFIILFILIPLVYSEIHRFITTYTGINGQTTEGTPEFSAVTTLDDQQIDYYDSIIKKMIPKQNWTKKIASTKMWTEDTEIREQVQQIYRDNIPVIMQRFTQTHGVHTYQRMYGCEWDDKTGYSHGFDQYGYDGEDFISLDLKENRYITSVQQASPTAMKWNNDKKQLEFLKQYYDHECVEWLKELLKLRKADLERKAPECFSAPEVSLIQKNPSSPVVCHATGLYPSRVSITWLRNGVNHYEDVDQGETRINEDGTFQKNHTLNIPPDDWKKDQFTCEVEHQGKTIQKILTEDEIKSNYRPTNPYLTLVCVIGGVFLIVLVIGAVLCIKFKKPEHEPIPSESEGQNVIDKGE